MTSPDRPKSSPNHPTLDNHPGLDNDEATDEGKMMTASGSRGPAVEAEADDAAALHTPGTADAASS